MGGANMPPPGNNRVKRDCVNVYIVYKHGLPRERRMLIQAGAEYHEAPRRH